MIVLSVQGSLSTPQPDIQQPEPRYIPATCFSIHHYLYIVANIYPPVLGPLMESMTD